MATLKEKTLTALLWSSIEQFSVQIVQLILGILIARILSPAAYGIIGMISAFTVIANVFVSAGFNNALIQKKDRDDLDFSTIFYFNIVLGLSFYIILFFSAPLIATFYKTPLLVPITRVLALTICIRSFNIVQRTKLIVELNFKSLTKINLIAITISGAVGLYLAYNNFGVWALVYQQLSNAVLTTLTLWYNSKWTPQWAFSYSRFRRLFSFGSKLLVSSLINTIFKNLYPLIIGKQFSSATLGYFTRGRQYVALAATTSTSIIQRVSFPVLSELQDNKEALMKAYREFLTKAAFIIFPIILGMAALAKPLIVSMLTDKWLDSVPILQILCFSFMWYPVHALNLNLLKVKGRSDLFLRLEIIKKSIIIIALLITVPMGIHAMVIAQVCTSTLALFLNTYYTKKIVDYGIWEQLKDLYPMLLLSMLMGLGVHVITYSPISNSVQLFVGVLSGAFFYISISYIINLSNCRLLIQNSLNKFKN